MTITTDKVCVKNGADYSFVCGKVPFAISCSSSLQHGSYNLIDMDLVNKMRIPLQKIKVCRMTYMGTNLRSVGYIDQTVHCVHNGIIEGTVHLAAKVVRNLFDNFNVDCIASSKTFERLDGSKPPDPPDESEVDEDNTEQQEEGAKYKENPDEHRSKKDATYKPSSSSSSSEDRYSPITKNWLFQASLKAEVAQRDPPDVLQEIWDEISNYKEEEKLYKDNASTSNDDTKTDDEEDHKPHDVRGLDDDHCHDDRGMENNECLNKEEMHCNLCFYDGKPIKIVSSHKDGCPTCPTMTPAQKVDMIGPYWKHQAEMIFKMRYKEKQDRRRRYAVTQ